MEHNAVMRPLRALEREGVRVRVLPCGPDGSLDPEEVERAIEPSARLVVAAHASNVTGGLLPVAELASAARRAGALFLLDTAQTAGIIPIDMPALGVDLLAFTGHKGLQGPPGTGGLILGERVDPMALHPLLRGGTGSHSEFEEQPTELPDRYESGTPNGPGIAGLGAGVRFVLQRGVPSIGAHELLVARLLTAGLSAVPGLRLQGPADPARRTGVVSFTVEGRRVSEIGFRLDEECGILCRVGLHCAPAAHRSLGTFPEGTIRLSPGIFTSVGDVPAVVDGVRRVVKS
jgi:selenocysteine lyase/cysteine desulfurase